MKTLFLIFDNKVFQNILLFAVISFAILSMFFWTKNVLTKRYNVKIATLEAEFKALQTDKVDLQLDLVAKKASIIVLNTQKTTLEKQLAQYKSDTQKQIDNFKSTIFELTKLPADTVYQIIFSKWPTYEGTLKFRFAENQIREMHLNILERDHYYTLSEKISKSLATCTALNDQNDRIILNLTDQNGNLNGQLRASEAQISLLDEKVKAQTRQTRRSKITAFVFKSMIVGEAAFITGLMLFK
jgi:peptidoglycan hydrolase CwlO-like protein